MQQPPAMKWAAAALSIGVAIFSVGEASQQRQTLAPHELGHSDAPAAILWDTPSLTGHDFSIETAEERRVRVSVIARHLEQPWSLAFLPSGDILVTERPGRLRIIRESHLDAAPIAGVPAVQTGGERGLQGLMDVVLHPRFETNHWVYLTYHRPSPSGGVAVLARGTWNGNALLDTREIFDSHALETEASRVAFADDHTLYMSISAPGSPDVRRAQDGGDYAGKIVRLQDDGSVPSDNPYVATDGYLPAIFTLGHRNGHGLAVNPETREVWQTEQGPSGGDELNILRAGRNYGWPFISYGRNYSGTPISARPSQAGFEDPAVAWLPSIGITGMTFYTGRAFPHWRRNLFVTSLRQGEVPRSGHLERIVFNERWEELRRESMLRELKQRMRDVRQGPDGALYVPHCRERRRVVADCAVLNVSAPTDR